MKLMPVLHVSDVERSLEFYLSLGFTISQRGRSGSWVELSLGDALLALHRSETLPPISDRLELCLLSHEPIERLLERLHFDQPFVVDEAFGRSFTLRYPDGNSVQINEHDSSLYA